MRAECTNSTVFDFVPGRVFTVLEVDSPLLFPWKSISLEDGNKLEPQFMSSLRRNQVCVKGKHNLKGSVLTIL